MTDFIDDEIPMTHQHKRTIIDSFYKNHPSLAEWAQLGKATDFSELEARAVARVVECEHRFNFLKECKKCGIRQDYLTELERRHK